MTTATVGRQPRAANGRTAGRSTIPTLNDPEPLPSEIGEREVLGGLEDSWTCVPVIMDYLKALEPATDAPAFFHVMALYNIAGAVMGRAWYVEYSGRLYAPHYTLLVGPSGISRKSTAKDFARDMLHDVTEHGVRVTSASGSGEGLIEALAYAGVTDEAEREDVRRAMVTRDMRALRLLDAGQRRLHVVQDEFSATIRKGKAESSTLSTTLLEAYGCPETLDVVTRKNPVYVYNPTLSILATSTPDRLRADLDPTSWVDGLMNRFALCYANPTGRLLARGTEPMPELWERVRSTLAKLYRASTEIMPTEARRLDLTEHAAFMWDNFYRQHNERQRERAAIERGACRRVPDHTMRYALIASMLRHPDVLEIGHMDMEIAQGVGLFLEQCAVRLCETLTVTKAADTQARVIDLIRRKPGISTRELHRHLQRHVKGVVELRRMFLEPLKEGEMITGDDRHWYISDED